MKTAEKISNIILLCFAIFLIYQAARLGIGLAIVVACLWFFVFLQIFSANKQPVKYDKPNQTARNQNELINKK